MNKSAHLKTHWSITSAKGLSAQGPGVHFWHSDGSMEQRFEMFGMKLSIINQNTTKNIPKNLLKPRPDEKGETCSQQAWKLDDRKKQIEHLFLSYTGIISCKERWIGQIDIGGWGCSCIGCSSCRVFTKNKKRFAAGSLLDRSNSFITFTSARLLAC